jgi:hypothetical protein
MNNVGTSSWGRVERIHQARHVVPGQVVMSASERSSVAPSRIGLVVGRFRSSRSRQAAPPR